jgi:hypothetical protein
MGMKVENATLGSMMRTWSTKLGIDGGEKYEVREART